MVRTGAATTGGKDYRAIAASKIQKPSDRGQRLPSFLIYARNKKGKTRFCTTAPDVLILDPERGTDEFTKVNPDVWPIHGWSDFNEVYQFLRSGDHKYRYVAFDGMTRFSNMALRFVMEQAEEHDLSRKPGMVQQRDYGKAGELMKGMMYNFQNLGVGTIYTAQERQIEGEFGEEDDDAEPSPVQYVPDLPKGVRSTVNALVDVIGRLYTVPVETDAGTRVQRRVWLAPSAIYDTGYRSEFVLPNYLSNPTVPRMIRAIRTGSPATKKEEK